MPNAGDIIKALDFPATVSGTDDNNATTTSTTFTPTLTGGNAAGCVFVAPTSGSVLIHNATRLTTSGAFSAVCGFAVRQGGVIGSGTVVLAEADARSIHSGAVSTDINRQGATHQLTGLTPGATYNVQQSFRTTGGTATFSYRAITVEPTQ